MEALMRESSEEAMRIGIKVLYLCDGPPDRRRHDGQMVVFTSPNEDWLNLVRKDFNTYFMPLWTLEELQQAAVELGFPLTDEDIEQRFEIFGGEARYCLSLGKETKAGIKDLVKAINKISSLDDLRNLLSLKEITITSHRLLHYLPDEDGTEDSTTLASPFVTQKLSERMLILTNHNREDMRQLVSALPQAGALFGYIFEVDAHEALRNERKLKARLLPLPKAPPSPAGMNEVVFAIETSETVDEFDTSYLSPSTITRGPYHKPKAKNWESIDAFYLEKKDVQEEHKVTEKEAAQWNSSHRLLLFQMTVSQTHDVNASGIINLVAKLGLLEVVGNDPTRVALVFVVPKNFVSSYERQKVVTMPVIGASKVDTIKSIGKGTAAMLKEVYMIETIDELASAVQKFRNKTLLVKPEDERYWTRAMNSWEAHGQPQRDAKYGPAMTEIPQYVCTWEQ